MRLRDGRWRRLTWRGGRLLVSASTLPLIRTAPRSGRGGRSGRRGSIGWEVETRGFLFTGFGEIGKRENFTRSFVLVVFVVVVFIVVVVVVVVVVVIVVVVVVVVVIAAVGSTLGFLRSPTFIPLL
jgi:Flp pilus assembly protein TadB